MIPLIYETAKRNFARLREEGILIQDAAPCYYVYRQKMGPQVQTGIVGVMSAAEYDEGKIRKHELTRQDKEDDRIRHVDQVNAQTGPVFISYKTRPGLNEIVEKIAAGRPEYTSPSRRRRVHTARVVADQAQVDAIRSQFDQVAAPYIADGHHRAAAGATVARRRRKPSQTQEPDSVLAAALTISSRSWITTGAVKDLRGLSAEAFLEKFPPRSPTKGFAENRRGACMISECIWASVALPHD